MHVVAVGFSVPGSDHLKGCVGKIVGKPSRYRRRVRFHFSDVNNGQPFTRTVSKWQHVDNV